MNPLMKANELETTLYVNWIQHKAAQLPTWYNPLPGVMIAATAYCCHTSKLV